MLYQDILIRETASLPEYLKKELLDFIYFLKSKGGKSATQGGGQRRPTFGCGAVKLNISADFDTPLNDFKEYME